MSLQELLREELDRAIGDGPAHQPVDRRIEAGRRALRRRRAAAALTAVGVVAMLGTTYAVVAPGPDSPGSGEIAVDPSAPEWPPPADAWEDRTPVRYVDEELQIARGVVVHEHVENPLNLRTPKRSDAFDLTFEEQRVWVLLEGTAHGYAYSSAVPSDDWTGFDDWLADQVAVNGGHGWPRTFRLTGDGRVVAVEGAEVAQRTDDPQLGAGFAPPEASSRSSWTSSPRPRPTWSAPPSRSCCPPHPRGTPTARARDEPRLPGGQGRGVLRVRRGPADPTAPDRLRDLRRLAPGR